MSVIMLSKCINRRSWLTSTANTPSVLDPMFAVASGYSITKRCVPSDTGWFITEQQITSYNGSTVWGKKWNFAIGSVCINSCGVILKCLESDLCLTHTHTHIFVAHCCYTKLVQESTNLQLPKSTTVVTTPHWGEPFLVCVWRQAMNV